MYPTLLPLCILAITLKYVSCFYNICRPHKDSAVSDEDCADLYFTPSEKETDLGNVNLSYGENVLTVTPETEAWTYAFVRITVPDNGTNTLCGKLTPEAGGLCLNFTPEAVNRTFQLEYKSEKLPNTSSRKFLFNLPPTWLPLFLYVDETDSARLILKVQKVHLLPNTSYFKVETYKEQNNVTTFQDVRLFDQTDDISYDLSTYNDEGDYFFVVHVMDERCPEELCLTMGTPRVHIGRKSTRLVIGIVGASFILPFVLFIFHILTKRYPPNESKLTSWDVVEDISQLSTRIIVAYKSSFRKHNEVVLALVSLLEKVTKNQSVVVDVIDLSKSIKKLPEKFCLDSIFLANRVVYVSPPAHDPEQFSIEKVLFDKEILAVVFDHCTDKLPHCIEPEKVFKLFEDFDRFMRALDITEGYQKSDYEDLQRKTEEAKIETEQYLEGDTVPQIVVTESEPQECDGLIAEKGVA